MRDVECTDEQDRAMVLSRDSDVLGHAIARAMVVIRVSIAR